MRSSKPEHVTRNLELLQLKNDPVLQNLKAIAVPAHNRILPSGKPENHG